MAGRVNFELVSPERVLVSDTFDMVVIPGGDGDIGVLPDHAPLISTIRPGVIDIHDDGKVAHQVFVAGGFAEVLPRSGIRMRVNRAAIAARCWPKRR